MGRNNFVGEWTTRPDKNPDDSPREGKSRIFSRDDEKNHTEVFYDIDTDLANAICREHNNALRPVMIKAARAQRFVDGLDNLLAMFRDPA